MMIQSDLIRGNLIITIRMLSTCPVPRMRIRVWGTWSDRVWYCGTAWYYILPTYRRYIGNVGLMSRSSYLLASKRMPKSGQTHLYIATLTMQLNLAPPVRARSASISECVEI